MDSVEREGRQERGRQEAGLRSISEQGAQGVKHPQDADSLERLAPHGVREVPLREWYVRLENIHVPTTLRGYRRITTTEDGALLSTVMSTYAFDERIRSRLQLWSSPFRVRPYARRLDGLEVIPSEYLFVYVRMV